MDDIWIGYVRLPRCALCRRMTDEADQVPSALQLNPQGSTKTLQPHLQPVQDIETAAEDSTMYKERLLSLQEPAS